MLQLRCNVALSQCYAKRYSNYPHNLLIYLYILLRVTK